MQIIPFEIRGDTITLDRLLKATGVAHSGGAAKALVSDGRVQVDGREELRKTAKLHVGQVVSLTGVRIKLLAAPEVAPGVANATADVAADAATGALADVVTDLVTDAVAASPPDPSSKPVDSSNLAAPIA